MRLLPASGVLILWLAWLAPAFALTVDESLSDPMQEARARALFYDIRCVVCQGEAIADSPSEVAHDMRTFIRERIAAGDSDAAVKDYLVSRYGEAVLMRPPLSEATMVLWFGPFIILIAAMWLVRRYFRFGRGQRNAA